MKIDFEKILENEQTLDPKDWSELRALGHKMVDDMVDSLSTLRDRPVWQEPSPEAKASFRPAAAPENGRDAGAVYEDFLEHVFPYPKGNIHPRFFSWVEGNGTLPGVFADFLASAMNSNVSIGNHSAMYVERQMLDWCKSLLGFPAEASGMFTSGATMANLTALAVARNRVDNEKIRRDGLRELPELVFYCSTETHNCLFRAAELIGLGSRSVRKIAVDENFKIRTELLREAIAADKAAGKVPFMISANAGTVNTGAIDPLDEMLELARRENLWFHVDGAFGAAAKLVPEFAETLAAIEKADSVAFDLHKWLYMPYEVGCVLIRDAAAHRATFATQANYLLAHERGLAAGPDPFANWGIELSRGFKALKIWFSLQTHGSKAYAELIRQNIAQAFFLAQLVENQANLELLAPVSLNLACFRYNPGGFDEETLNRLNKELLMQLQERGIAAPSYTVLNGKYAIRVNITNHRSRKADFEALVSGVLEIGKSIFA